MTSFQSALLCIFLSLTFGHVEAFWRMRCGTVQVGRVDPIVSPGGVAGHCHTIAGPNNINTTSTFDDLQAAFCTSCEVQADKSAYWTPNLYYRFTNGTFAEVPHDGTVAYYLDRGVDVPNMKPFPPGFRMLSGDAAARAFDPNTLTWGNKTFGPTPISNRASFACLDSSGPIPETPGLNITSCDSGLRAQIHFQSCWDGVNLYKSDQSHVAYLSGMDNGVCPPGYPILLPHIFLEIIYFPNAVATKGDGGMFVFSQGDTTGYGFHGDFLNGWDPQVQIDSIKQCMGVNATNNGAIGACPPLAASEDPYFNQNCPEQPPVVNERVHGLIPLLPGCNPPTGGPLRAAQNICPIQPAVNVIDNQDYKNRSVAAVGQQVGSWQYMGCAFDNSTPRPLAGKYYYNVTGMTIETCTAYCKQNGYAMAGMEASSQCYCGSALSQLIQNPLTCAAQNYFVCSGNLFEFCGGQQLMQIWSDTTYTGPTLKGLPVAGQSKLPLRDGSTATYQGCYTEGVGARALPGSSYSNSTGMSLENCAAFCTKGNYALFGTEYAQECYCGNSISTSQVLQNNCSAICTGDNTEFCGGNSRLSVWALSNYVPPPTSSGGSSSPTSSPSPSPRATGITYLNCVSETSPNRALNASYTSGGSMTVDQCAFTAQALNLAYFGLEYASQCVAGNVLNAASTALDPSKCGMKCAGNATQTCGGSNAISLYNNTLYVRAANPNPVNVPNQPGTQYGYVGCYGEPAGARALGPNAQFGSTQTTLATLTVEACAAYCFGKGYPWMGVENANQCFCNGAGVINGAVLSPGGDADCSTGCQGDPKENCGGNSKINIYQLKSGSKRRARRTW